MNELQSVLRLVSAIRRALKKAAHKGNERSARFSEVDRLLNQLRSILGKESARAEVNYALAEVHKGIRLSKADSSITRSIKHDEFIKFEMQLHHVLKLKRKDVSRMVQEAERYRTDGSQPATERRSGSEREEKGTSRLRGRSSGGEHDRTSARSSTLSQSSQVQAGDPARILPKNAEQLLLLVEQQVVHTKKNIVVLAHVARKPKKKEKNGVMGRLVLGGTGTVMALGNVALAVPSVGLDAPVAIKSMYVGAIMLSGAVFNSHGLLTMLNRSGKDDEIETAHDDKE